MTDINFSILFEQFAYSCWLLLLRELTTCESRVPMKTDPPTICLVCVGEMISPLKKPDLKIDYAAFQVFVWLIC